MGFRMRPRRNRNAVAWKCRPIPGRDAHNPQECQTVNVAKAGIITFRSQQREVPWPNEVLVRNSWEKWLVRL